MKISLPAVALVALAAAGCPKHQAPTSGAADEPDFCAVVSEYLAGVAAQEIREPMAQLDGFESSCSTKGEAPELAVECRADTSDELGDARYDELTGQVVGCLADWEQAKGDTDPSGAPETYRWTTLSKAGQGAQLQTRLHYFENRLVVDLAIRP